MWRSFLLGIFAMALLLETGAAEHKALRAEAMLPSYCFAGSRVDKEALGGFGRSDNDPKRLSKDSEFAANKVSLIAQLTSSEPFRGHAGFQLLLVNRTGKELAIEASDSRLPIVREARDEHGKWRPIEYLPQSWCGNSAHRVFLPANHYWEFPVPQYEGTLKTKLRFVLKTDEPIYSAEYEGSIDPRQFGPTQADWPVKRKPHVPHPLYE